MIVLPSSFLLFTRVCVGAILVVALATGSLHAETALQTKAVDKDFPRIAVRVGVHQDFQRIVFDWPSATPFDFKQDGSELEITFRQSAALEVSPVLHKPITFVKNLEQSVGDESTKLKLFLDRGVVAQVFKEGPRVVVDLKMGEVKEEPAAATDNKAPAADVAEKKEPLNDEKLNAEEAAEANAEDARAESSDTTVLKEVLTKGRKVKPVEPQLPDLGDRGAALLSIDPGNTTGAAIFRRAGYVYLAFDNKVALPFDKIVKGFSSVRLEPVDTLNGTVYRFFLPQENISLRVARNDTIWSILASRTEATAPINLNINPQPNFALGGRLVISLNKVGTAVRFYDPEVGDLLIAVPLPQMGQAIRSTYSYADLDFVAAEQGIVIKPKIDGIDARRITQGVEIISRNGLRLSPETDTGIEGASYEGQDTSRLFDFRSWYGPTKIDYTEMRQRWERTLVEVPKPERDRVRFDLARFNFARNHPHEAHGQLIHLERIVPDISLRSEYLALRGAVSVLIRHSDEALKDFNHPDIRDLPEARLWQAVAYAQMLNWTRAAELFAQADSVLDSYPEPHFTNFSFAAIEAGLAGNNAVYAGRVLDRLVQRRPELERISPTVQYLRGVFLSLAGHLDRAEILWKRAAVGGNPMYRVRSILALTDLDIVRGKIKPAQAAERLERLRFAWRGDDLELDVLRRLGKFYIEAGKVADGLATLKQVLAFLADNDAAKKLRDEMAFTFRDVFLGKRGENLSPLDALSLYERFYELAPIGNEGDAIIRSLAGRMVAVDLLDRAASILADQVRRRLSSTFKSRVGAQAAGIYLLDGKADAALKILGDSIQPALPNELVTERDLLKVKALYDLGQREDAIKLLADLRGDNAERLRADIAWKERRWPDVANALEILIGPALPEGLEIPQKTAQLLTSRAIALAMANDVQGLEALRQIFGNAMRKTPQNELFRSLTEPESGLPSDDSAMKAVSADVQLFQDFLEGYRTVK